MDQIYPDADCSLLCQASIDASAASHATDDGSARRSVGSLMRSESS